MIGQVAEVAVGAYTEIQEIIAPSEAASAALVTVEVRVKNIWTVPFHIVVAGHFNGTDIAFSPEYTTVDPGTTYSFSASFTMPNNEVTLDVWSFYWTGEEWHQDDYNSRSIALEVAPPEEALPEVSWLPLALFAGLGVLGVGAAVAIASRKS